jgi:hypothetical protein
MLHDMVFTRLAREAGRGDWSLDRQGRFWRGVNAANSVFGTGCF